MSDSDIPTFNEAITRFHQFISEQGHDVTLHWVFRNDIVERVPQIFVRLPLHDSGQLARRFYEEGVQRGLGIHLNVYCFLNGQPLCYIWLPEDETDAEYRMLSGLKLTVPSDPGRCTVVGVRSRFRWAWLRRMERRASRHWWADDIPQR